MEYKFTSDNFEAEVINSEIPVLVDFYADWCGPCKMMMPVVEKMAETYDGKVKVGKVNSDDENALPAKYNIMSIPSFLVFKNDQHQRSKNQTALHHLDSGIQTRSCD